MVHCGTARALPGKVHTNSAVTAGGGVGGVCYYLEYSMQVIEVKKNIYQLVMNFELHDFLIFFFEML